MNLVDLKKRSSKFSKIFWKSAPPPRENLRSAPDYNLILEFYQDVRIAVISRDSEIALLTWTKWWHVRRSVLAEKIPFWIWMALLFFNYEDFTLMHCTAVCSQWNWALDRWNTQKHLIYGNKIAMVFMRRSYKFCHSKLKNEIFFNQHEVLTKFFYFCRIFPGCL